METLALVGSRCSLIDDGSTFDLVPVITVFIKHEQVEFGNNLEFHKRNKHLGQESRNARLAEETSKVSRNVCWTLQRRRRSRHSTHRRLKLGLVLTLSNTASKEYRVRTKTRFSGSGLFCYCRGSYNPPPPYLGSGFHALFGC